MESEKNLPTEPPPYGFSSAPPPAADVNCRPPSYTQHHNPQNGYPQYVQQVLPPPQQPVYAAQSDGPIASHSYAQPQWQNGAPAAAPPPAATLVRPSGCFNRTQINRPQMNVLNAACVIFISGGMHLAWSIGFHARQFHFLGKHTCLAWFIGAAVGAAISAFVPRKLPTRAITIFCSTLALISGIISASCHSNFDALTAALYLNGLANGLLFAPTLTLAGEISAFYMRGQICASTEQLSVNLGIFLQIMMSATSSSDYNHSQDYNPNQMLGILGAVFGFLGICFAALFFIDSPVTLLSSGRDIDATDALRRLQRPYVVNEEVYIQLAEHRLYLAEAKQLPTEQTCIQAIPACVKLCILGALNALSISSFIYQALEGSSDYVYKYFDVRWSYVVFGACRLLGSFFASCTMDSIGRKKFIIVGLLVCGCLAFATGAEYLPDYNGVTVMLQIFQLSAGIAFTAASVYLAEAYPLNLKTHFISITLLVELVVFIIIAACDITYEFFYVIGAIYLAFFVLAFWWLPETRRTTLREARKRFRAFC